MLYITSLECIPLLTGSLYTLTNLTSQFPTPDPENYQSTLFLKVLVFYITQIRSYSILLFSFTTAVPFYIPITNVWELQFLHTLSNTCYLFVTCYHSFLIRSLSVEFFIYVGYYTL